MEELIEWRLSKAYIYSYPTRHAYVLSRGDLRALPASSKGASCFLNVRMVWSGSPGSSYINCVFRNQKTVVLH